MKKINKMLLSGVLAIGILVTGIVSPVFAVDDPACQVDPDSPACKTGGNVLDSFDKILGAVLAIVGVIAVIVLIIAGVTMMTSQGDPGKVKKAKNAIIYTIIGLVVVFSAWAIVNFAVGSL